MLSEKISLSSSNNEPEKEKFPTNVLLVSSIGILSIHMAMDILEELSGLQGVENMISSSLSVMSLAFLLVLYKISRSGYHRLSAYLLLSFFYILFLYTGYKWGVDLPISILLSVLMVIMSGVLLTEKAPFLTATIISATITVLYFLQQNGTIQIYDYWEVDTLRPRHMVIMSTIIFVIAMICWISNKQVRESLKKARESEKNLLEERQLLEIKVEERTEELKRSQKEALIQFYRFAEYGKISTGLFHDLVSPLMAVSFNIDRIKKSADNDEHLKVIKEDIERAKNAVSRMEHLVTMTRKHFSNQTTIECFSINKEIVEIVEMLSYKTKRNNIRVVIESEEERFMKGNPVSFGQIISNLISNAIEAYDDLYKRENNEIRISIEEKDSCMIIKVEDNAEGIPDDIKEKIFTLFTTKGILTGTGVGLYLTRELVEKEFGGKISFDSSQEGTTFSVSLPKKKK
jgi:signal transduction histidine kinase